MDLPRPHNSVRLSASADCVPMMLQFRAWTSLCDTGFSSSNSGRRVNCFRFSGLVDAAHRWLPPTCEEILYGRNGTLILDQFHALEYAAAAVQAVTLYIGERKAWMERIREQLDAQVIAAL